MLPAGRTKVLDPDDVDDLSVLIHRPVGQGVPQVPAGRQQNHLKRKPKPQRSVNAIVQSSVLKTLCPKVTFDPDRSGALINRDRQHLPGAVGRRKPQDSGAKCVT